MDKLGDHLAPLVPTLGQGGVALIDDGLDMSVMKENDGLSKIVDGFVRVVEHVHFLVLLLEPLVLFLITRKIASFGERQRKS